MYPLRRVLRRLVLPFERLFWSLRPPSFRFFLADAIAAKPSEKLWPIGAMLFLILLLVAAGWLLRFGLGVAGDSFSGPIYEAQLIAVGDSAVTVPCYLNLTETGPLLGGTGLHISLDDAPYGTIAVVSDTLPLSVDGREITGDLATILREERRRNSRARIFVDALPEGGRLPRIRRIDFWNEKKSVP